MSEPVVVKITESITLQLMSNLTKKWKATCPLADVHPKRWTTYADTRLGAERRLRAHMKTHAMERGSMF